MDSQRLQTRLGEMTRASCWGTVLLRAPLGVPSKITVSGVWGRPSGVGATEAEVEAAAPVWCKAVWEKRPVVGALKMLARMEIDPVEIDQAVRHAKAYCAELTDELEQMSAIQQQTTVVLLLYLAHVHVSDVPCELVVWWEEIFEELYSYENVERAALQLLKCRDYRLRVSDAVLEQMGQM
mmetsp:Transcript_39570/g.88864  ORF Transcript_39570/g.88864 Transcript_39570/m.88864 type:complete len:181 (+) Transcript_39570:47-589(+)